MSDTEDIIKEVEDELRNRGLPLLLKRTMEMRSAINNSQADLDQPIQELLNEMETAQANLVILRAMRIAGKREMNAMKRNVLNNG